ncbi:hypothetical protein FGO68_gene14225 [Halteria grandinella]|uniref:Uncharacterized protein n=1 Tax=Halteria grandinella TaxID=5974 RepID=A0A8J8NXV6_HALGN|nr:hypothetical protein FGO68_gene14225 [Halteria grandinella]
MEAEFGLKWVKLPKLYLLEIDIVDAENRGLAMYTNIMNIAQQTITQLKVRYCDFAYEKKVEENTILAFIRAIERLENLRKLSINPIMLHILCLRFHLAPFLHLIRHLEIFDGTSSPNYLLQNFIRLKTDEGYIVKNAEYNVSFDFLHEEGLLSDKTILDEIENYVERFFVHLTTLKLDYNYLRVMGICMSYPRLKKLIVVAEGPAITDYGTYFESIKRDVMQIAAGRADGFKIVIEKRQRGEEQQHVKFIQQFYETHKGKCLKIKYQRA